MSGSAIESSAPVMVVGAGIMGAGIAQVAAEAGHQVLLFDSRDGAAAKACEALKGGLAALVAKGKRSTEDAEATLSRIKPVDSIEAAVPVVLVVEAIIEDLAAKRALFQQLETLVTPECVLATNTSSISVTAIANGLQRPQRLVGMHFFNPVPVMKLVEVVSGLQTDPAVAQRITALSSAWGKTPVHARSTPGFIVNRIARPFYAEALALLAEQGATPSELDACMRSAGFRMGPCELMDLIGHDTNFAVTASVFDANFGDKRFVPSIVQKELVDGGLLGRKSGRGFYDHRHGVSMAFRPKLPEGTLRDGAPVLVHGEGRISDWLWDSLAKHPAGASRHLDSEWVGISINGAQLRLSDGRCASQLGAELGIDLAVFDWPMAPMEDAVLGWASAGNASAEWKEQAALWLSRLGFAPVRFRDTPGLIVARTVSMLINEAADAVNQGVCEAPAVDAAMKLGVNYPAGPFTWLAAWSEASVIKVLRALDNTYRGERYRVSPELQRRAWAHAGRNHRGDAR